MYPKKINYFGNLTFLKEEDYLGEKFGVYIKNDDLFFKYYLKVKDAYHYAAEMTLMEKIKKFFYFIFKRS